jgi:hypothetical protein
MIYPASFGAEERSSGAAAYINQRGVKYVSATGSQLLTK